MSKPFDFAYIGFDNRAVESASTVTATNLAAGYSAASLQNWQVFDNVVFDAGAGSITIDCGAARPIDYFSIVGHSLFSTNADDIVIEAASNAGFTTDLVTLATLSLDVGGSVPAYSGSYALDGNTALSSQQVYSDPIISFKLDTISRRYYRITFTAAAECRIGVIALGQRLTFDLGFYGGFTPPSLNESTDVTNNKSESGQYLGRSIVREGVSPMTINLNPVRRSWVDAKWTPFRRHADLYPFVFSWGNNPLIDNMYGLQKSWQPSKAVKRIRDGSGNLVQWMSVGIQFEGVIK